MDDRINDIYLRLIKFFKDHEGENVTFEQLSKEFSYEELIDFSAAHCHEQLFEQYILKMPKPKDFTDIVESRYLDPSVPDYEKRDLLFLVSEDFLLELVKTEERDRDFFRYFRTDEYRLKAMSLRKVKSEEYLYVDFIETLDDDEKKVAFAKKIFIGQRESIIRSIKSNKIKESLIPKYIKDVDQIIRELPDENMRIYYYEKYFDKFDDLAKYRIFSTFTEENKLKYLDRYWKKFSTKDKIRHLSCIEDKELILEKSKEITRDVDLVSLIDDLVRNEQIETAQELAKRISYRDRNLYKKILDRGDVDAWGYLDWEKLLRKYSEKKKLHLITQELPNYRKIHVIGTLKDFKAIEQFMAHYDDFEDYGPKYSLLIHKYALHYNLNEEHLITLLKTYGMELLKDLKSPNIQQIINFNEEDFNKVVNLFKPSNYELDNNTINDNINILLQRMFKQNYPDIININPRIKFAIQQGDKTAALSLINGIIEEIDISKILKKHNLTSEQFFEEIFKNDSPDSIGMKCLHEITTAYIVQKRNQYIQEHIEEYRSKFSNTYYENKSALKYMIENFPIEYLMENYFYQPTKRYEAEKFNEQEIELLKKPEIIKQIIDFRRNPSKYETMPEEVKKHMSTFNKIFEKTFDGYLPVKLPLGAVKVYHEPEYCDGKGAGLDILFMLDPELLKKGILASEEQYKLLAGIMENYKILGWNEQMQEEFAKYDLMGDSYTIGFLIKYFPVIYNDLQSKVEKGELKAITLTSLLDLAQCYSMDTTKRAFLFGSDNIRLIASNPGPNKASGIKQEERMQKAEELMPKMVARKTVAVPSCDRDFELPNGKKINIVVGNFSNPINLTYGERTGACMRIGGAGEKLFDFCLENEHGFHIRFSSPEDERFASRVSGFRNGNTVFLNELRFSTDPRYSNQDIKDACTLIAQALIEETKDSPNPIQNVVIAPAYVMEGHPTVSLGVSNIKEGLGDFYSDVGKTAVVVATSNPDNTLVPVNLSNKGVPRYPVQRDRVRYYTDKKAEVQMKRIEILDQMLSGKKLEDVEVREKKDIAFCYCGEDWYVTVDKQGNITEYVMENSTKKELANREKRECLKQIKARLGITTGNEENVSNNTNTTGGAKK